MKIAILFRGKIRGPEGNEIQYFKDTIDITKKSFDGHEITTYLNTWNDNFTPEICKQKLVDNIIATPEPTMAFCMQSLSCPHHYKKNWGAIGTYSLFYGTRKSLFNICSDVYKYDYICITRTDIQVSINPNEWFNDKYVIPDERRYPEMNDQFAVARPNVAYNAWDFKSSENLNNVLGGAQNHEDALLRIMRANGVSYEIKKPTSYKFKW